MSAESQTFWSVNVSVCKASGEPRRCKSQILYCKSQQVLLAALPLLLLNVSTVLHTDQQVHDQMTNDIYTYN